MIPIDVIKANVELSERDWEGVSSIRSNHIRGLKHWALSWNGGVCAGCGEVTLLSELAHIVSAPRGSGKGFVPFNIYLACKPCNDFDREFAMGDPFTIARSLSRPDLVFKEIIPRKVAIEWDINPEKERAFAIRSALLE